MPADLAPTVDTLSDVVNENDGVLSLREAIALTNDAVPNTFHTISFSSSIAGGTITLDPNLGQLTISKKTIISAPTSSSISIERDPNSNVDHRIFYIDGTSAEFRRLNLYNGSVPTSNGGAVYSANSHLIVRECTFSNNAASQGGAIAAYGSSYSLLVYDSEIYCNSASLYGGGISIGAMMTAGIHDTLVWGNSSAVNGGGIYIAPSMYTPATTVTLDGVEVYDNTAQNKGGGIFVDTAFVGLGVALTLTGDSEIHDNELLGTNSKGGGIYFGRGIITLDGVTIANNDADSGDGMYRVTGTSVAPNPDVTYTNDSETVGS